MDHSFKNIPFVTRTLYFVILLSGILSRSSALQCACNVRPSEINHMLRDLSDQTPLTGDRPKPSAFRQVINEVIQTALKDCEATGHCDLSLKETARKHIRPACMAVNKGDGQNLMSCYFTDSLAPKSNYTCTDDGMYLCFRDHCNHFEDGISNPCSSSSSSSTVLKRASKAYAFSIGIVASVIACLI